MSHIFISYSRNDIEFAGKIVQALAEDDPENKLDTWIDWKSIPKGEDWEQEIYRGIEEADAFLFLLSPDSVASEMCNKEIAHAVKNGKRMLPIFIANVGDSEIDSVTENFLHEEQREEICRRNFVKCRDEQDDFNGAIEETRETIHTDYEWLKYHTKLQVKALDWERREDKDDTSKLLRGKELQEAEQKLASAGSSKDPPPTDLHRQYVAESRKVENAEQERLAKERKKANLRLRNRAFVIVGIAICAIVTSGLALMFGGQVGSARISEQQAKETAQAESTARIEQALTALAAITQKAEQAVTAQAQVQEAANAIATAQVASGVNESIARKLSAQAGSISLNQGPATTLSGLLAVESIKRFPHLEADQALRNYLNIAAIPISSMKFNDFITSADFSPDGKWVAVASFDGTLQIQEIGTGRIIANLTTDSNFVKFSPNGKWLATIDCVQREEENYLGIRVCASYEARIWDTNGWYQVSHMAQDNYLSTISFSPDSKWAVSGGNDQTVKVWDVLSGEVIANAVHSNSFCTSCIEFSPDGKLVASASSDGNAIIWEATTGREIVRMTDAREVDFISFSPDSQWIVSGGNLATPIVWDANTGEEIARMDYDDSVENSVFSPDGRSIISSSNAEIIAWDASTGQVISHINTNYSAFVARISADSKQVFLLGSIASIWDVTTGVELQRSVLGEKALAISSDGKRIAFANDDGTFYVGEFPKSQEIALMEHQGSVKAIAFSPNGNWIASGSDDGTTRVWDVSTGQEISHVTVDGLVVDVDFSSDGQWVAQGACEGVSEGIVACGRAIVRVWETTTGKEVYQLHPDFPIASLKLTPDGKDIILTGGRGSIQLWNLVTARKISSFTPDLSGNLAAGQAGTYVYNADIDPTGRLIIANGQVWDISSGEEVYRLSPDAHVGLAIFSPSGKWIASSSANNVRLWDAENGKELMQMPVEPFTGAASLAFSLDEKWLVGADGTMIHVWETSTGRETARITTSTVISVDLSSDGKWIASGNYNNTVHIWLWRPEDLFTEACLRLPRNFTNEEWSLYIGNEPYHPTCPNLPIPEE